MGCVLEKEDREKNEMVPRNPSSLETDDTFEILTFEIMNDNEIHENDFQKDNEKLENAKEEGEVDSTIKTLDSRIQKFGRVKIDHGEVILTETLGKGATGHVFSMKNKNLAVKRILAPDQETQKSIDRQIEILQLLNHPHLVHFIGYDFFDSGDGIIKYFFLMERAQSDLSQFLKANPGYFSDKKKFYDFMKQMLQVGEYLVTQKISLRDIKPQNILVFPNGVFKLADIGFAKQISERKSISKIVGCPTYMAPEIAKGYIDDDDETDLHLCDVYSMGIVFMEICGVPPRDFKELNGLRKKFSMATREQKLKEIMDRIGLKYALDWLPVMLNYMLEYEPNKRKTFSAILKEVFPKSL